MMNGTSKEEHEKSKPLKVEPCEEYQPTASFHEANSSEVPRGSANRKERKRTLTMNSAFAELRDHIPNVPPDTKLSKIKTLRLAISYIKFLMEVLEESNDGKPARSHHQFVADLTFQNEGREKRKRELSMRNIPSDLIKEETQLKLCRKTFMGRHLVYVSPSHGY